MILKISLRAKGGVPKTLLEQKHRLNFLYFPQNTLMLTESREEFSDLHSIFRLRALRYTKGAARPFFPRGVWRYAHPKHLKSRSSRFPAFWASKSVLFLWHLKLSVVAVVVLFAFYF